MTNAQPDLIKSFSSLKQILIWFNLRQLKHIQFIWFKPSHSCSDWIFWNCFLGWKSPVFNSFSSRTDFCTYFHPSSRQLCLATLSLWKKSILMFSSWCAVLVPPVVCFLHSIFRFFMLYCTLSIWSWRVKLWLREKSKAWNIVFIIKFSRSLPPITLSAIFLGLSGTSCSCLTNLWDLHLYLDLG